MSGGLKLPELQKDWDLGNGCSVGIEYVGKGNIGWGLPDKWTAEVAAGLNPEIDAATLAAAMKASPLNDLAVVDGKISIELDFELHVTCFKNSTRADKCNNGAGCKGKVQMDFTFWVDIDFMFPEDGVGGEADKGKENFKRCLDTFWMPDSACLASNADYLEKVARSTDMDDVESWQNGFDAWIDGELEKFLEAGFDPKAIGVPDGVWDALESIYGSIKAWDLLELLQVCACLPDANFNFVAHVAKLQHEIDKPNGKGQDWADIVQHYVRSFWDAAQTGDTDYITNIESYDEIITLAADARRLGRS